MAGVDRAFVAVYPPAAVLDAVDARLGAARRVAPDLRWSPRNQWHVTLRFIGRVADVDALSARLGDAVAALTPVEGLALAGAGAFPTARRGSVLWVGVADGPARDALGVLAAAVDAACGAAAVDADDLGAGLESEDRVFTPHCTVARARRPVDLRGAVDAIGPDPFGDPCSVTEVRLVASAALPTGAVHTDLARFPFTP